MEYSKYPPTEGESLDPTQNTRDWIDLKLNSLKGEMRVWFIAAIAGNQLLNHITLAPLLGYIGGGIAIVGAILAKVLVVR